MKSGTDFENLAASIFEQLRNDLRYEMVKPNVDLPGVDGPRQIDVLLRGKVGPLEIMTIVECKDHNRIITVEDVDALHSKMQDVKANKAVLVSRKGFSGTAKKKADRLGVTLCTAHQAKSLKWPFAIEVPFLFIEDRADVLGLAFRFQAQANSHTFDKSHINGSSLTSLVAKYWDANPIDLTAAPQRREFVPPIAPPHWIFFDGEKRMAVTNCRIEAVFYRSFYFGYFNALESAKCLEFIGEERREVVYDPKELINYREKFARYTRREDVPAVANLKEIHLDVVDGGKIHGPSQLTVTPAGKS